MSASGARPSLDPLKIVTVIGHARNDGGEVRPRPSLTDCSQNWTLLRRRWREPADVARLAALDLRRPRGVRRRAHRNELMGWLEREMPTTRSS
jgi:hypothetical protein